MANLKRLKASILAAAVTTLAALAPQSAPAAMYDVDTMGMHAFVQFKVLHLGYSVLVGRFNQFSGSFEWDKSNPSAAKVDVTIQTASLDSNHAERDKHLRSADYLNVEKFPTATFKSTSYSGDAMTGKLKGDLTLNGVTKPIEIALKHIGEGNDPWGGYRAGFQGTVTLNSADFGYTQRGFPSSIDMELYLEGVQRK